MSLDKRIKRGKESWDFIYLVFAILLAIVTFIISILPISWQFKVIIFSKIKFNTGCNLCLRVQVANLSEIIYLTKLLLSYTLISTCLIIAKKNSLLRSSNQYQQKMKNTRTESSGRIIFTNNMKKICPKKKE